MLVAHVSKVSRPALSVGNIDVFNIRHCVVGLELPKLSRKLCTAQIYFMCIQKLAWMHRQSVATAQLNGRHCLTAQHIPTLFLQDMHVQIVFMVITRSSCCKSMQQIRHSAMQNKQQY